MQVKKNDIFTLLTIFSFSLQIRNLFILKFVQQIGYTVNIYSMFPFTFYLSLILCYFIAAILVVTKNTKMGFLVLCFNHLEILLIPYMLGYYSMGRADDISYIGEYLQIINSGHFAAWDIYPASHTIGAFISIISGIEPHYISFIIPIVFSFIFIIGINLFSREMISQTTIDSLVIVSSFILYIGIYNFLNVPHALFFSFIPFYLCYFHKYTGTYKITSLSIIFVLMTLLIPITHPFIVFFVFSFFLLDMIPKTLFLTLL